MTTVLRLYGACMTNVLGHYDTCMASVSQLYRDCTAPVLRVSCAWLDDKKALRIEPWSARGGSRSDTEKSGFFRTLDHDFIKSARLTNKLLIAVVKRNKISLQNVCRFLSLVRLLIAKSFD